MAWRSSKATSGGAMKIYLAILGVLVIAGVAMTVYQYELGLVSPGPGATKTVFTLAQIDSTLDSDADYAEFSSAVRVGVVALSRMPVYNTADNRVQHSVSSALDCYSTLREIWQVDLERQWNDDTYGDPEYWRGFHPGIELEGEAPMSAQQMMDVCRAEARGHLDDALALVAE